MESQNFDSKECSKGYVSIFQMLGGKGMQISLKKSWGRLVRFWEMQHSGFVVGLHKAYKLNLQLW